MHTRLFAILSMALVMSLMVATDSIAKSEELSDSEIRQRIIHQSIASYPGRCPCPYNLMSNGKRCGKRSAWSKPGGYAPMCYPKDVTDSMVKTYRRKNE